MQFKKKLEHLQNIDTSYNDTSYKLTNSYYIHSRMNHDQAQKNNRGLFVSVPLHLCIDCS